MSHTYNTHTYCMYTNKPSLTHPNKIILKHTHTHTHKNTQRRTEHNKTQGRTHTHTHTHTHEHRGKFCNFKQNGFFRANSLFIHITSHIIMSGCVSSHTRE